MYNSGKLDPCDVCILDNGPQWLDSSDVFIFDIQIGSNRHAVCSFDFKQLIIENYYVD